MNELDKSLNCSDSAFLNKISALLRYDAGSGKFFWLHSRGRAKAGKESGMEWSTGYIKVTIFGKHHLAHRLAWLFCHGEFPSFDIDHINGIKTDNRIENLRPALRFENQQNQRASKKSQTGIRGVYPTSTPNKWDVRIKHLKKYIHIGRYGSIDEAVNARLAAEKKYHPYKRVVDDAALKIFYKTAGGGDV
jgi:hypothetical protein